MRHVPQDIRACLWRERAEPTLSRQPALFGSQLHSLASHRVHGCLEGQINYVVVPEGAACQSGALKDYSQLAKQLEDSNPPN